MTAAVPVIVELIGLPGSGKTAATLRAIELLAARGVDVVGYDEFERYRTERGDRHLNRCNPVTRFVRLGDLRRRHPDALRRVRALVLLHGALSPKRWRKARRPLTNLHMIEHLPATFAGRVLILDDGFLQKLWSMLVGNGELEGLEHVEALLAEYYAATGVRCIRLEVADDVALERVFGRDSKGRFNRDASERLRDRARRWFAEHHAIRERMPAGPLIARIDGAAPPETVAIAVADCIERVAREGSAAG